MKINKLFRLIKLLNWVLDCIALFCTIDHLYQKSSQNLQKTNPFFNLSNGEGGGDTLVLDPPLSTMWKSKSCLKYLDHIERNSLFQAMKLLNWHVFNGFRYNK